MRYRGRNCTIELEPGVHEVEVEFVHGNWFSKEPVTLRFEAQKGKRYRFQSGVRASLGKQLLGNIVPVTAPSYLWLIEVPPSP